MMCAIYMVFAAKWDSFAKFIKQQSGSMIHNFRFNFQNFLYNQVIHVLCQMSCKLTDVSVKAKTILIHMLYLKKRIFEANHSIWVWVPGYAMLFFISGEKSAPLFECAAIISRRKKASGQKKRTYISLANKTIVMCFVCFLSSVPLGIGDVKMGLNM